MVVGTDRAVCGIAPFQRSGEEVLSLCHHLTDHAPLLLGASLSLERVLPALRSESVTAIQVRSAGEAECAQLTAVGEVLDQTRIPCPVLDLDSLEASVSNRLLRNARQMERRLAREVGAIKHLVARPDSATIEAFFTLNEAWRTARGGSPLAATTARRAFLHQVLTDLSQTGQAWFSFLMHAGRPVSALLYFTYGCTAAFYASGHDPELGNFSVGTVHLTSWTSCMRGLGYRWVDFLRGGEGYKYRFGARDLYRVANLRIRITGAREEMAIGRFTG